MNDPEMPQQVAEVAGTKDISSKLDEVVDVAKDNSEALNSLTSMLKGQFTDLIKYAECKKVSLN
jgi:hypothetical protein